MSQNKTVIKGLEPADAPNVEGGASGNFYTRAVRPNAKGTVVPGMEGAVTNAANIPTPQSQQNKPATGKPVVGFLYSISRTAFGEYWPVHIGQNTIGQNPASDIVLPEGTVSSDHAVLVVRKMKNPEKVIASISDARSTNGTMLNGESLGFSAVDCKNGDIITIGDNYELLLVLVDAPALGLKVREDFIPVQTDGLSTDDIPGSPYTNPTSQTIPGSGYAGPMPPPFPGGSSVPLAGTVGIDGSAPAAKGGTVGIDDPKGW
ncbi:MAG: FHA domain-containing protein [Prevotella sp.]|nr:FHA domain-containing protein [Prevotella sp.]